MSFKHSDNCHKNIYYSRHMYPVQIEWVLPQPLLFPWTMGIYCHCNPLTLQISLLCSLFSLSMPSNSWTWFSLAYFPSFTKKSLPHCLHGCGGDLMPCPITSGIRTFFLFLVYTHFKIKWIQCSIYSLTFDQHLWTPLSLLLNSQIQYYIGPVPYPAQNWGLPHGHCYKGEGLATWDCYLLTFLAGRSIEYSA